MPLTATPADIEQMKRIENEVAALLVKYRQSTEAAIVAFALTRLIRLLLSLYGDAARSDLKQAVIDHLNERECPRYDPADPAARLLIQ